MEKNVLDKLKETLVWKKKINVNNGYQQRWLDESSIITFSVKQRTGSNIEFLVNGNPNHLIWYTQLSDIFLDLTSLELISGYIKLKNGNEIYICTYDPFQFENLVLGKKFKVKLVSNEAVSFEGKIPCVNYSECLSFIKNLLEKGEVGKAAGYLSSPRSVYGLEEV